MECSVAAKVDSSLYDLDVFTYSNDFKKLSANVLLKNHSLFDDIIKTRDSVLLSEPRIVFSNSTYITYRLISTPFNLGYAYLCNPIVTGLPPQLSNSRVSINYSSSFSRNCMEYFSLLLKLGFSVMSRSQPATMLGKRLTSPVEREIVPKTGRLYLKATLGLWVGNFFYPFLNDALSVSELLSSKISSLKVQASDVLLAYRFHLRLIVPSDVLEELKITDHKPYGKNESAISETQSQPVITKIRGSEIIKNINYENSVKFLLLCVVDLGYDQIVNSIEAILEKQQSSLKRID